MNRCKRVLKLTFAGFIFQCLLGQMSYGQSPSSEISEPRKILEALAENFKHKIDEEYSVIVQFDILDEKESWNVVVEKG